jgi:hypothetical protein
MHQRVQKRRAGTWGKITDIDGQMRIMRGMREHLPVRGVDCKINGETA